MVKFQLYDVVRLVSKVKADDGKTYKRGTKGAIIEIYGDHEAYEFDLVYPPYGCFTVYPGNIIKV